MRLSPAAQNRTAYRMASPARDARLCTPPRSPSSLAHIFSDHWLGQSDSQPRAASAGCWRRPDAPVVALSTLNRFAAGSSGAASTASCSFPLGAHEHALLAARRFASTSFARDGGRVPVPMAVPKKGQLRTGATPAAKASPLLPAGIEGCAMKLCEETELCEDREVCEQRGFSALRKLTSLQYFDDESLRRLVQHGQVRRFSRYQALYSEGAVALSLLILVGGVVQCQALTDESGRKLRTEAVFGLETLAGIAEPWPSLREESTIALQPSVCLLVQRDHLRAMMVSGGLKKPAARKVSRRLSRSPDRPSHT